MYRCVQKTYELADTASPKNRPGSDAPSPRDPENLGWRRVIPGHTVDTLRTFA